MDIPKSINLAGLQIKTAHSAITIDNKRAAGCADYDKELIVIDKNVFPKNLTNQTYIHEVLHWILFILNYHELNSNEQFVDSVAHLLHQALISATPGEIPSREDMDFEYEERELTSKQESVLQDEQEENSATEITT